jgi:hypothetical protein
VVSDEARGAGPGKPVSGSGSFRGAGSRWPGAGREGRLATAGSAVPLAVVVLVLALAVLALAVLDLAVLDLGVVELLALLTGAGD